MLGGEGPINENSVTGHFVINEYAKLFNALIISIEHRQLLFLLFIFFYSK